MNTTETKVEYTPEPWNAAHWNYHAPTTVKALCGVAIAETAGLGNDVERCIANAERICQCVNACAGIADPKSAIAAARDALMDSVKAAEYVVRLIEQTGKAGVSPNPMEKADWLGAAMHCYAAMSFIQKARQALERLG
jgi:hypothetical protein